MVIIRYLSLEMYLRGFCSGWFAFITYLKTASFSNIDIRKKVHILPTQGHMQ